MDCMALVLQLCLFDPSNLYLSASVENTFDTNRISLVGDRAVDPNYGLIDAGLQMPGFDGRLTITLGVRHRSFTSTGDDVASHSWFAGLTWRPFAR